MVQLLLIGELYIWAVFPISNNQRVRNNQKWGMVRTCLLMIHRFSIHMSHAKGISVKKHLHVRSSCWTWQFFIGIFSQRGVSENRGFTLSSKAKKSYFIHWTLCFLGFSPAFSDIFREPSNSSILNVLVAFPHGFSLWFFTIGESLWLTKARKGHMSSAHSLAAADVEQGGRPRTRKEPKAAVEQRFRGRLLGMVTSVSATGLVY